MVTAKVLKDDDGLIKGEIYEVEYISMGQSYSSIYLKNPKEGTKNPFNSVIFNFYENEKKINIFKDRRFNPYI